MATLFRENGIEYEKINYFNEALTENKLRDLANKSGLKPIKLTRGAAADGLTAETPDDEVIAAMAADPNLIQRPIVEVGDRAVVARPIDKALELLK